MIWEIPLCVFDTFNKVRRWGQSILNIFAFMFLFGGGKLIIFMDFGGSVENSTKTNSRCLR